MITDFHFYINSHVLLHFRVCSGEFGHYVVATRDIEPLEKIIVDDCPSFVTKLEHDPVCLECWDITREAAIFFLFAVPLRLITPPPSLIDVET